MTNDVGIHVSIAGSVDLAVDRAKELGCVGTFQIFTCSPRRWAAPSLSDEGAAMFRQKTSRGKFEPFAHMPYMPNLASPNRRFRSDSLQVLIREIRRCDQLGIACLVVHLGSPLVSTVEEGKACLVQACRDAIERTEGTNIKILLENSAGGRKSLGADFFSLHEILSSIDSISRTGVCFDTCHAYAAGHDLRDEEAVERTMSDFDSGVGLDRLVLIHANDSKANLGQGVDRHQHIGQGKIGVKGFRALFKSKAISDKPVVLETPVENEGDDRRNLFVAKKLANLR